VHVTALDCSFCILDKASVSTLCNGLVNLESLKIVDCGVQEFDFNTPWPKNLKSVDFSRNQLTECPQGLALLVYLRTLNLSGNLIQELGPSLLKLPLLEKLYLLQNPLQNVPKHICREGVAKMREYFKTDILPLPPQQDLDATSIDRNIQPISRKLSNSSASIHTERRLDLRRYLLHQQGSFDSGYESSNRCRSTSGSSIDYMSESDNTYTVAVDSVQWPSFNNYQLPEGYAPVAETTQCRVYLPGDCKDEVTVELVKDLSLYPTVQPNELLITPVVHIAPHGIKFSTEAPAVVVLPHCTKPSSCNGTGYESTAQELIPVYSNSGLNQPPAWGKLDGDCDCEAFDDCVLFKTTHFSLFAVVSVLPYPTASISIGPNHGGVLTVPELPGFEVNLPPTFGDTITVTATVYYDDAPYNIESNEHALASPCIALEPHGTQFSSPVQISLPIPNYAEILSHFPDAKLELWHATAGMGMESLEPENWKPFQNTDNISITQRGDSHVLIFTTGHFSWWETLWDIGRRALQKIGLGANVSNPTRTRYVSVRIQAFMSQPIGLRMGGIADIQTFGLLVAVYKFGTPLSHLSNYPWSLLDTGSKRVYVQLGPLEVSIQGCFSALEYEDPSSPLTRVTELIEFDGEDFCQRFEFALQLEAGCEVQEGMLMGKLRFRQWKGTTPVNQNYNLMAKVSMRLNLMCVC
jgi:Leucine-rich repeat (LRR) protein